ncbi:uncharacterized protein LOC129611222 [Condylostylus longicornis]|uniref:uncharacterized protein LOC129611222 n=1 Tax=Condylostylus longicornis TaxID=2530218 RepID=UPI00244E3DB5|nr:uncharacterized protein LOC129611222 [Condylostylus longicornis]
MDLNKNTVTETGDKVELNNDTEYNGDTAEFLKIYSKMAENIRDEHFEEISKIVKSENMTFNIDSLRLNFVDSLGDIINKMYEARNLKQKLLKMKVLEERYKKKEPLKWHPHGKTAEQQTISQRMAVLNKRKNFMFELLERQRTTLEETTIEVERNRKRLAQLKARRDELNLMLDIKTEQLKNVQNEFTNFRLKMSR